jgi:hypothetical protein
MMKKIFFAPILCFLFLTPQFEALAQSTAAQSQSTEAPIVFDMTGFPQWARDMRRFDIVAFGTFPFSMFVATFVTDMFRWYNANGMDFNDLRYAPWPLKSAGSVDMTAEELQRTILIAAGISVALAITDLIIVHIRRNNERRRVESRPPGPVNIYRGPYENGETGDSGSANIENGEADGNAAANGVFE